MPPGTKASTSCEGLRARGYRWPLDAFVAPERGIAQVRNALVERSLAKPCDFIAMLDDDRMGPNPIGSTPSCARSSKPGPTRCMAASCATSRLRRAPGPRIVTASRPLRGTTGRIPMIDGSGNIIVSRACFDGLAKPCFDPRLRAQRRRGSRFLRAPAPSGPLLRLVRRCGRACFRSGFARQPQMGTDAGLSRRQFRHARIPEIQTDGPGAAVRGGPRSRA